jgi:hypothetical protein
VKSIAIQKHISKHKMWAKTQMVILANGFGSNNRHLACVPVIRAGIHWGKTAARERKYKQETSALSKNTEVVVKM